MVALDFGFVIDQSQLSLYLINPKYISTKSVLFSINKDSKNIVDSTARSRTGSIEPNKQARKGARKRMLQGHHTKE
jgi:hypothetical protein